MSLLVHIYLVSCSFKFFIHVFSNHALCIIFLLLWLWLLRHYLLSWEVSTYTRKMQQFGRQYTRLLRDNKTDSRKDKWSLSWIWIRYRLILVAVELKVLWHVIAVICFASWCNCRYFAGSNCLWVQQDYELLWTKHISLDATLLKCIPPSSTVPLRPEDGTVPVVVLIAIESICVTDCNFNFVRCPCNEPVR